MLSLLGNSNNGVVSLSADSSIAALKGSVVSRKGLSEGSGESRCLLLGAPEAAIAARRGIDGDGMKSITCSN